MALILGVIPRAEGTWWLQDSKIWRSCSSHLWKTSSRDGERGKESNLVTSCWLVAIFLLISIV